MKRADLFFTAALPPLDYAAILAAAALAYLARFSDLFRAIRPVTFDLPFGEYLALVFPIGFVFIAIFAVSGLYASRPKGIASELTRMAVATAAATGIVLGIAFLSRELFDSRFIFVASWIFATIFLLIERGVARGFQGFLRRYGIGVNYMIVIGASAAGDELRAFFNERPAQGYRVVDHFRNFNKVTQKEIRKLKAQDLADGILVANPNISREELNAIKTFSDNEAISFFYSAELFPGSAVQPILHTYAGVPVVEVPKTPLDGWGAIYKRVFDIAISLLLILITLPLQIVVSILLALEKQGGIFFHQNRIGQRGKPFRYFKFRSMIKDAHAYRFDDSFIAEHGNMREGTPLFKLKHDPRVTRVGRFLRTFSIDEVPEFYLVLLGSMSLVGPRPHLPEEVEMYKPHQHRVLTIKPGITGMAQVSGRANLTFDDEVRLDMHYIENWSPWLDLVILLKTPLVVLLKRGAY